MELAFPAAAVVTFVSRICPYVVALAETTSDFAAGGPDSCQLFLILPISEFPDFF